MKRVIVLGAEATGVAAAKLLIKNDIEVLLYDNNPKISVDKIKNEIYGKTKLSIELNDIKDSDLNETALCVISPEFPKTNSVYVKILKNNIPVISELELGYLFCKGEVSAVTGTNGKSTVAKLVSMMFENRFKSNGRVAGEGNLPFSEEVIKGNDNTKYIVDCNSFQLEEIMKFKPKVASILNISPNALDRYDSFTEYINVLLNISMNQTNSDYLILNYEDSLLRDLALQKNIFNAKVVFFSSKRTLSSGFYMFDEAIYYKDNTKTIKLLKANELKLFGEQNYENVMAAIAIAYFMGVPFVSIVDTCKTFEPMEHRLEFVREKNGVKYYNDAKSDNPVASIRSIDAMKGKILLISGGRDRGVDFGDFILKVKDRVRYLILIGETKKKLANKARDLGYNTIIFADSLDEAVDIANSYSNIGDNVLFSPACSALDMFKDYNDRGSKYKTKVLALK